MKPPLLEIRNLSLQRGGVDVLKNVSLEVEDNDVLALIGPNGSGKTSLLLALARLMPVSRGELLLRGEVINGGGEELSYRRKLAMVFQEPLLLDTTVTKNVASGLSLRRMETREKRDRVQEVLELFGITGLSRRTARSLSSGEARRVSLARAFAVRPELIFMDEPFTALDLPVREALFEQLVTLLHAEGITAVIATHDCREVLHLCNRVAVLAKGRLTRAGSPREVLKDPQDEFTAAFARHAFCIPETVDLT